MKLPPKQLAALAWILEKEKQGMALALPHTWNFYQEWETHKTSINSFYAVERKRLAERRNTWFWHLTPEGRQMLESQPAS